MHPTLPPNLRVIATPIKPADFQPPAPTGAPWPSRNLRVNRDGYVEPIPAVERPDSTLEIVKASVAEGYRRGYVDGTHAGMTMGAFLGVFALGVVIVAAFGLGLLRGVA